MTQSPALTPQIPSMSYVLNHKFELTDAADEDV